MEDKKPQRNRKMKTVGHCYKATNKTQFSFNALLSNIKRFI